jgi:hypothetical protein
MATASPWGTTGQSVSPSNALGDKAQGTIYDASGFLSEEFKQLWTHHVRERTDSGAALGERPLRQL